MAVSARHFFLSCLALWYSCLASSAAIPELDMKSAYLYNFARFVDWTNLEQPVFNICTLEKVSDSLSPDVLMNKSVNGKKIKVSRFSEATGGNECQIVYLNAEDATYSARIALLLSNERVLTIGEGVNGAGIGIINWAVKNDRLVFDVHLSRARKANITLSSKLITLAHKVRE